MNLKNDISIHFSYSGAENVKSADNAAKDTKKEDVKNDSIFNQNIEKTNDKDSNVENDQEQKGGFSEFIKRKQKIDEQLTTIQDNSMDSIEKQKELIKLREEIQILEDIQDSKIDVEYLFGGLM